MSPEAFKNFQKEMKIKNIEYRHKFYNKIYEFSGNYTKGII